MRNALVLETGSLVAVGILAISGYALSLAPAVAEASGPADSTAAISASLEASSEVGGRELEVEIREGVVYLTGSVATGSSRDEAGRIARRAPGVEGLVNDLTVVDRTADGWVEDEVIGSRVRLELLTNPGIELGDVDVTSSDGILTLIGRVSSAAIRTDAEKLTRETRGVREVRNHLVVGRIDV